MLCLAQNIVNFSVTCCSNGNHNRKDLSYRTRELGPGYNFVAKRTTFCRSSEGEDGARPTTRALVALIFPLNAKALNGIRERCDSALPTLFCSKDDCVPGKSSKRKRLEIKDESNARLSQSALVCCCRKWKKIGIKKWNTTRHPTAKLDLKEV